MKQTTLGSTDWALKSKVTRRAQFLNEMEAVVPWPRLLAVIELHYPKTEEERPPHRCRGCCDLRHPAMVQSVGSGDGGCAVRQRSDASLSRGLI